LQERQRESGCLPRAGLRTGKNVLPFQNDGNCLTLNRGWGDVTLVGNGAEQLVGKTERAK
jgi:hypothetical protein